LNLNFVGPVFDLHRKKAPMCVPMRVLYGLHTWVTGQNGDKSKQ